MADIRGLPPAARFAKAASALAVHADQHKGTGSLQRKAGHRNARHLLQVQNHRWCELALPRLRCGLPGMPGFDPTRLAVPLIQRVQDHHRHDHGHEKNYDMKPACHKFTRTIIDHIHPSPNTPNTPNIQHPTPNTPHTTRETHHSPPTKHDTSCISQCTKLPHANSSTFSIIRQPWIQPGKSLAIARLTCESTLMSTILTES